MLCPFESQLLVCCKIESKYLKLSDHKLPMMSNFNVKIIFFLSKISLSKRKTYYTLKFDMICLNLNSAFFSMRLKCSITVQYPRSASPS